MKRNSIVILLHVCIGLFNNTLAQDTHWSQLNNSTLYQNPALTCIDDKFSFGINYRDQWNTANKTYKTFLASGDYRVTNNENKNVSVGVGGIILSDISAKGNYRTNSGGITLSCITKLNKLSKIGGGLGFNFTQNTISTNNFTWGTQYDGTNYNKTLSSGETEIKASNSFFDLNAGISYIFNKYEQSASLTGDTKWILSYSISHINKPDIGINGNTDKLSMKHSFLFTGAKPLRNDLAFRPSFLINRQGKMIEITLGSLFRFSLGEISKYTGIRKGSSFSFGAFFRYKDAIIPAVEFQKSKLTIAASYDINISKFSSASKFRGGFELCLRYSPGNDYLYENKEKPKNKSSTRASY